MKIEKQSSEKDIVLDAAKKELNARDDAKTKLNNIETKRSELQKQNEQNEADRTALITKTDEIIGRGGSIDAVSNQVRELQAKSAAAEATIKRLTETLIPSAKSALDSVNMKLLNAVKSALIPQRQKCEKDISDLLEGAMDILDKWVELSEVLFAELGLDRSFHAGGLENSPRPKCDRAWQLIENGILLSPHETPKTSASEEKTPEPKAETVEKPKSKSIGPVIPEFGVQ